MNIEHISISRQSVFKECQQKYKFKYHLKVPSNKEEQFYFTYGKIVHKIAELFVKSKGEIPIGEISKDILRGKIDVENGKKAPPLPLEYSKKLPNHLRAIQSLTEKIGFQGELEYSFKYDLMPPHRKMVTGVIDRFFISNGKAFIIDYKTTKKGPWRKTKQDIVFDLQLRTYAKVIQKETGIEAANIKAALYYLDGPDLVATTFNQDLIDHAEKELLDVYLKIETKNPDQVVGTTGSHCPRCDYSDQCQFYNIKY